MITAFLAFFLATLQPPPSVAPSATAQTQGQLDEGRLAAARELVAIFVDDETVARQGAAYAAVTANAAIDVAELEAEAEMPAATAQRVHEAAREDANTIFDLVGPIMERLLVDAYARQFSADELRRLTMLMSDPLVRRMEELSPSIMQEAMEASMGQALLSMPTLDRMERAIREWKEDRTARPPTS